MVAFLSAKAARFQATQNGYLNIDFSLKRSGSLMVCTVRARTKRPLPLQMPIEMVLSLYFRSAPPNYLLSLSLLIKSSLTYFQTPEIRDSISLAVFSFSHQVGWLRPVACRALQLQSPESNVPLAVCR